MVCATRSIKSTQPRMVMAVSRAYKPKVVYLVTSLGE